MPKRRNDKNKGPEKKKSYKYPKEEDNIYSSENSNEIVLDEAKLDKNKYYKFYHIQIFLYLFHLQYLSAVY